MKQLPILLISILLLTGCTSTPNPQPPGQPRVIVAKQHDPERVIYYPTGDRVIKPEAWWLLFSDDSWLKVTGNEWKIAEIGGTWPPSRFKATVVEPLIPLDTNSVHSPRL